MPDPKMLYVLIGPKGSGKTYIGTLVSRHTDIAFLRVEPIWLGLQPGENAWAKIIAAIGALFQAHDKVMIESLGIGEEFRQFYSALAASYPIQMIHVVADPDTCLKRVKTRSKTDHIPVSDDQVTAYNQMAATVSYPWALEIDNNLPASDAEILAAIRSLGGVEWHP